MFLLAKKRVYNLYIFAIYKRCKMYYNVITLRKKAGVLMNCNFPKIISDLRKSKGISQKQAAIDLGVSQALLSHYEKGIRECGLDFLIKLSNYYDVSCDELLGVKCSVPEGMSKEVLNGLKKIMKEAEKILNVK